MLHICKVYKSYIRFDEYNWYNIFNRCSFSYFVLWVYALLSTTLKPEVIKFWGTLSAEHAPEIGSKMISSVSVVRLAQ